MNHQAFMRLCKLNGFRKTAPYLYARCIGDGIYQTIYTGFSKYIDPPSPYYSVPKRKSKYISISILSLYSTVPEYAFTSGTKDLGYRLDMLIDSGDRKHIFHGIEQEYEIMGDVGFDFLNSINSHERLLEIICNRSTDIITSRKHDISLIAPFLMCNDVENALFEICYAYTHRFAGFHKVHADLLTSGNEKEYCQCEICEIEALSEITSLWEAWLTGDQRYFIEYLDANLKRNLLWAKKYNIPFVEGFKILDIPNKFFM